MWNMPDRKGVGNGDYRRFVLAWGGGHPDEHRNPVADSEVKKISGQPHPCVSRRANAWMGVKEV